MLSLTRREMQAILAYSLDMLWFACPGETAQKTCAAVGKRGVRHPDTLLGHLGERCLLGKQLGRSVTSTQTSNFSHKGLSYKSPICCRNGYVCQPEAR